MEKTTKEKFNLVIEYIKNKNNPKGKSASVK